MKIKGRLLAASWSSITVSGMRRKIFTISKIMADSFKIARRICASPQSGADLLYDFSNVCQSYSPPCVIPSATVLRQNVHSCLSGPVTTPQ